MKGMPLADYAKKLAQFAGQAILDNGNPWFKQLDTLRSDLEAKGQRLISFANYDYLGLNRHPAVTQAAANAIASSGVGALGSRLVGGERSVHAALEQAIADFVGSQSCMALVSGYLANISIIPHLTGGKDLVLYDELCHNSITSGVKTSKASAVAFQHNDLLDLEEILRAKRDLHRNCLVIVEGLYSMDGDIPNLSGLLALKDKYSFWLIVDEAHSIGVLGDSGRGISEHFGEDPAEIDLVIGTLSKSMASCGGFICGHRAVIDWLRFTLPGFVYSVGLSPVIAASAHAALGVIAAEPERTAKLRANSELFLRMAREAGLDAGDAIGRAIVPILFDDLESTMAASEALLEANIFAPPVVHIGVPKNAPRIRFFISAEHERGEIEAAIDVLRAVQQGGMRADRSVLEPVGA